MSMNRKPPSRVSRGDSGDNRRGTRGGQTSLRSQQVERDRATALGRPASEGMEWKRMDLHLHTPASSDYRDPGISYLDVLKKAEEQGLHMIAFADHNSVSGYAAMHREIETLTLLERLGRLTDEERTTLDEYRRLLAEIVVLPGFEFTATFGFHILGIFPENTSVRKLEYLLLDLNVPEEKMVLGAPDAGSTSDVLTAYQAITAAGGLAIAAHANSSNGVAMQGFPFGGQTKIAYTQDPNLVALEVTDLEGAGRRTTASFYNASKPEYPRRMHLIQGSDAHSLDTEQSDSANKRLGVGARATEILVEEASFAALKEILTGNDFTRTRPSRSAGTWESFEKLRMEGQNVTQSFHERAFSKMNHTRPILRDIVAFANTEGGTIYVGVNPDTNVPIHGVERPEDDMRMLKEDMRRTIEPPLDVQFDIKQSHGRGVIVVTVPKGDDQPYAFTPTGQIMIRVEDESVIASRDEIVDLVLGATGELRALPTPARQLPPAKAVAETPAPAQAVARGTLPPQQTRPSEERREMRTLQQPERRPVQAQSQQAPTTPPAQAPTPERVVHSPLLANLPPEKIKGKIQPMGVQSSVAPPTNISRVEQEAVRESTPVGLPTVPLSPEQAPERAPAPSSQQEAPQERRRGRRKASEAAAPPAAEVAEKRPEPVAVQPETTQAEQPKRGRGRRKATEAEASLPMAEPMEATVSAEHETREEIVEAEAEKPKRGRRRTSKAQERLEVEAPTASAAASDAGAEAILTDAQVQPGPQIPAEVPEQEREPDIEAPPVEKRGRPRRKTAAQKAAEAAAASKTPAQVEPAPVEAPAKGRGRGRSNSRQKSVEAQRATPITTVEPPEPPKMGVEIVSTEARNGINHHTVRNLQNGQVVHNVTRRSAKRLWHYAILQHEHGAPELAEVLWHPEIPVGLWRQELRAGVVRYDLVSRYPDGSLRIFYGVTDDGLTGPWREVVQEAERASYTGPEAAGA